VIDPGFIGDLDRLCVFDGGTRLSLFLCDGDVQLFSRDAQQLGIVNDIFPAADFDREVMARARRLARGPSITYRYMKENLNRAVTSELGDCMDVEVTHHVHSARTQDHREAADAFVSKREPRFIGR